MSDDIFVALIVVPDSPRDQRRSGRRLEVRMRDLCDHTHRKSSHHMTLSLRFDWLSARAKANEVTEARAKTNGAKVMFSDKIDLKSLSP